MLLHESRSAGYESVEKGGKGGRRATGSGVEKSTGSMGDRLFPLPTCSAKPECFTHGAGGCSGVLLRCTESRRVERSRTLPKLALNKPEANIISKQLRKGKGVVSVGGFASLGPHVRWSLISQNNS